MPSGAQVVVNRTKRPNGLLHSRRKIKPSSAQAPVQQDFTSENGSSTKTLQFCVPFDEYVALLYFSDQDQWMQYVNKICYRDGKVLLRCPKDLSNELQTFVEKKISRISPSNTNTADMPLVGVSRGKLETLIAKTRENNSGVLCLPSLDGSQLHLIGLDYHNFQKAKQIIDIELGNQRITGRGNRRFQPLDNNP